MKILNFDDVWLAQSRAITERPRPYLAMYSSLYGGIVTDPRLMTIPLDDHMVHRGDGVFEALRCIDGAIYDADAHLERLMASAAGIALPLPVSQAEIKAILLEVVHASKTPSGTLRIFVSRGPGDFSPNPYSTTGSQLYVVYTSTAPFPEKLYREGVTLGLSVHPAKPRPYCNIKSCNYLVNVLMKKEAVDRGLDFMVATTADGEITESSTENVALVTKDLTLVAPPFENMLRGTTLVRVLGLVAEHGRDIGLRGAQQRPLFERDFGAATCALVIGTTMGILPVRSFESTHYAAPKTLSWLGPLTELLKVDIATNESRRTRVVFESS